MIASIAELAKTQDPPIEVMVVTGDRDAYQLVDEQVSIMTTSRGITDTRVYDRQGVIDRYGIPPELVPDFIGLKGDTSDNIPGVPGIGDKTAADLLQRFGSLEQVLDSVDEISGAKRKQNLTEHADDARVSKQLATAKRDIPLDGLDVAEFVSATTGPLAAARGVPRVRAARPAAPAGGGAGIGGRRRARAGGRARAGLGARSRGHPGRRRAVCSRCRGGAGGAHSRDA